jgi:hypothetical protein
MQRSSKGTNYSLCFRVYALIQKEVVYCLWDVGHCNCGSTKMVLTTIQWKFHNIKCSEEDNLWESSDKAQDLYACIKEIGAKLEMENL